MRQENLSSIRLLLLAHPDWKALEAVGKVSKCERTARNSKTDDEVYNGIFNRIIVSKSLYNHSELCSNKSSSEPET